MENFAPLGVSLKTGFLMLSAPGLLPAHNKVSSRKLLAVLGSIAAH